MNRTIEEIKNYFNERPELRDEVNKYLSEGGYLFGSIEGIINEVPGGKDNPQGCAHLAHNILSNMDRGKEIAEADISGYRSTSAGEFSRWYIGEREEHPVICYKGFNQDMTCLEFQYEVGKEYENDKPIWACYNGFHACQFPLDVLMYYDAWDNRYCVVEQWGYMDTTKNMYSQGAKTVSSNIRILREIGLKELFEVATTKMRRRCEYGEEETYERGEWTRLGVSDGKVSVAGKKSCLVLKDEDDGDGKSFLEDKIGSIIGNNNIIGIMTGSRSIDILGVNNKIYPFGDDNLIRLTGDANSININEGEGNVVVMTGYGNAVRAKGKVEVTLVGNNTSVNAGIGSRINFVHFEKMISIVIDGKDYTENDIVFFHDGKIEKRRYYE